MPCHKIEIYLPTPEVMQGFKMLKVSVPFLRAMGLSIEPTNNPTKLTTTC